MTDDTARSEKKVVSIVDPLMNALLDRLPPAGSAWPLDERGLWFSACEAAINLLYGPADRIEVLPSIFVRSELSPEHVDRLKEAIKRAPPGRLEIDCTEAAAKDPICTCGGIFSDDTHTDDCPMSIEPKTAPAEALAADDDAPAFRDVAAVAMDENGRLSPLLREPTTQRPAGIPTTFGMIREVLEDKPGLTAKEVVDAIAARWWPGLQLKSIGPDISTSITKGRLARDDAGGLTVTAKGLATRSTDDRTIKSNPPVQSAAQADDNRTALMREIAKRESVPQAAPAPLAGQLQPFKPRVPAPGQKLGPPARAKNEHEFQHGATAINLRGNEYMVATKLRAAMGKGHISVQFLAETVLGSSKRNAIDSKMVLKDLCEGMSARLRTVGLVIDYFEGYGFIMKETSGG